MLYTHRNAATAVRSGWGALAQYTKVSASATVLRPKNVTPTQASGFTIAGITAYQALVDFAHLRPGQSVFINGGSTAVGICAIQMAKATGCTVTACASTGREEFLKSLGVDHVSLTLP